MWPAIGVDYKSSSILWEKQLCRQFSLAEVREATRNFEEELIIGRGGFGKVYKGVTSDENWGTRVTAIKRLDSRSNQGAKEFWAEIEMLSRLRHCHLVSLIGYCNDEDEMILVYEYMPNGSLDDHLHKVGTQLSWVQRLKICIGAARGLDYLHTGIGTQHGIIHRDVKSSNILLDENWASKISDFGLSKVGLTNQLSIHVSSAVKGTFGYVDPEYFTTGILSIKSDVYAFGVVLFEVLSGRRAVDTSLDEEQWGLARWAQDCTRKGKLDQIVDSNIRNQVFTQCLKKFTQIAGRCLHNHPQQRPTMAEVVVDLELTMALQERLGNAVQPAKIATFSRMLQMFFSTSNVVNSDHLQQKSPRDNKRNSKSVLENKDGDILQGPPHPRIFTYAELVNATMNFGVCLSGNGGVGSVYKGWVDEKTYTPSLLGGDGMAIAVRMEDQDYFNALRKRKLDLKFLGEHSPPNHVKLLGYCLEVDHLFCIYEFMQNGSLERHISRKLVAEPLSWVTRLKIAEGAAQGLAFLHKGKQIFYRQFKTSLILMDRDFNAKLDPVLEKLVSEEEDSYLFNTDSYYAAPEWFAFQVAKLDECHVMHDYVSRYLSVKSEVYSFGVVLLEILTGQQVYDATQPTGKQNLVKWVLPMLSDIKNMEMVIDPYLKNFYPPKGAFLLGLLIVKCLQSIEENRPSMNDVLKDLKQITAIKT